jgi:hypothetical protein
MTYPAKVYFTPDNTYEYLDTIYSIFESMNIPFHREDNFYTQTTTLISDIEVEPKKIKQIYRNFRTHRPKLLSDYRYLFWEIDTTDIVAFEYVNQIYVKLNLPVYIHRSLRGFHFISIKPIPEKTWLETVSMLRRTNVSYPPITLRINPNKYEGEEKVFYDGHIQSTTYHYDTSKLVELIRNKKWHKIQEQYILVWYNIDKVDNNV